MNNPLISIIIPTFNRAWCINRAIDSCLAQSYQNFEIVITDDGSTDNTETKILEYKNEKIRYFKFLKNKGMYEAQRNSIENSNGEYIVFLDSDDELLVNCLETFVQNIYLLENDINMLFADFLDTTTKKIKSNKHLFGNRKYFNYKYIISSPFFIGDFLPFVKKDVFEKVPYVVHAKRMTNIIWHKIFKISSFVYIDSILAICHTEGEDRRTKNRFKDSNLWIEGINEYINTFYEDLIKKENYKHYSLILKSLAIYQYQANEIYLSRQSLLKAIRYNPINYKNWIYLFASFNKYLMNKLIMN